MKTRKILLTALALSIGPAATAEHPLTQKYLEGLFRAKPHLATFMGDHRFDGFLADLSPDGLRRRERELMDLKEELSRLAPATFDDRIDSEILASGIDLELLYLREIRDWEWDPRLSDSFPYHDPRETVAGRLSDIIHGDFAPEAERRAAVAAQLGRLPDFLDQMEAALSRSPKRTSREYLDQAVKMNRGRIEFFETEVKAFAAPDPTAEAARGKALMALRAYQEFLEKDLSKRADGDWRLGAALYKKKFPLALQTDLKPEDVIPRAEASFRESREKLLRTALKLHEELWPGELKVPPGEKLDSARSKEVIEKVRGEISKDHPAPEGLVTAHERGLDGMRAFIQEHDLLELPPRETLRVIPMPAFKRGAIAAEYLAPGVLEGGASWTAVYSVDPIDPTWPPDRVESYLRGHNTYEIQLTAIHEAYPGHHTQYFYSKKNRNRLRAVLWNPAMVEGWAVYCEELMVRTGYGEPKNDRFRFYELLGKMTVATNVLIDIRLHCGEISDAEAVRLMTEEGFQEKAMAEKKLLRAKLDSTQLAQYFLGYDEIRSLEADYRKKVGEKWTQRAFDEALIGRGSIAVKFLRRYMLRE